MAGWTKENAVFSDGFAVIVIVIVIVILSALLRVLFRSALDGVLLQCW